MAHLKAVLLSTYELGRQPFGLASPAAWLRGAGVEVSCIDLAIEQLDRRAVAAADLIGVFLPMHTATRLAAAVVPTIQELNPQAHLCFYGLYAPINASYLRGLGADSILGGEFEADLLRLAEHLSDDGRVVSEGPTEARISLERLRFRRPDRSGLPALCHYAQLQEGPDRRRLVGYTEASRGCKHLCRHCPIVPIYNGTFRVVQRDVVLSDVRQQVQAGAQHITFGDPDFFNGPTHSLKIVRALREEFPQISYDVTIKIEHLVRHMDLLPVLKDTGCSFVTSAVESIDPVILDIFDKHHTRADFLQVVQRFGELELALNPTFVTFTPWTTLEGYLELLELLADQGLVDNVAPIQYAIRLLIPEGSRLLELPETQELVHGYDEEALCYAWEHPDRRMDALFKAVTRAVHRGLQAEHSRRQIFAAVWRLASEAYGREVGKGFHCAALDQALPPATIPYLTEPWYC
jgi:radical SAM superfamily enzyme YgiQ (UPF0313 family)